MRPHPGALANVGPVSITCTLRATRDSMLVDYCSFFIILCHFCYCSDAAPSLHHPAVQMPMVGQELTLSTRFVPTERDNNLATFMMRSRNPQAEVPEPAEESTPPPPPSASEYTRHPAEHSDLQRLTPHCWTAAGTISKQDFTRESRGSEDPYYAILRERCKRAEQSFIAETTEHRVEQDDIEHRPRKNKGVNFGSFRPKPRAVRSVDSARFSEGIQSQLANCHVTVLS